MKQFLIKMINLRTYRESHLLFPAAAAFFFLIFIMFSMIYLRRSEEMLSARIAPEVLRFHVLANSDSSEDQALKLEVKEMLIDTIYAGLQANLQENMPVNLQKGFPVDPASDRNASTILFSKELISSYISEHREQLEKKAENFMADRGFSYSASVRTEKCYFPTKIYGDVVFPCGTYDAVRVLLGDGDGKNWWCVLYPPLCFTDNATAVVPDSSKKELKNLLSDDDFYALMKNRRVVFGDSNRSAAAEKSSVTEYEKTQVTVRVRSRFIDLLTNR